MLPRVFAHLRQQGVRDVRAVTTEVTDAFGNVTTYHISNLRGTRRVTRVAGPCHSCGASGGDTQTWGYDDRGRIVSYTNGAGETSRYEYDTATGDLLKEIDALDQETTYTYDGQRRVLTRSTPDGGLTTYTYVAAGPATITEKVSATESRTTSIGYTAQGTAFETFTYAG